MSRRKKHEEHEEHENHERWLVSYADMVTVLMALFIVMYAMSSVDQEKFDALKSGLAEGFGAESVLTGNDSVLSEANDVMSGISPQLAEEELSAAESQAVQAALQSQSTLAAGRLRADAEAEVDRLDAVYARLQVALKKHGLEDDVQATYDDRGLVVSLVSRHVVFAANLAELSPRGREIVDTLAPVLREIPDPLQIDGHTNQAAGAPMFYPTDWDLASARAITVLRRLSEQRGIPGERLTAASYGHERPLVDPSKPGSQAVNKRVDIVIVSSAPAATRALLAEVADEKHREQQQAATPPAETTDPSTTETTDHSTSAEGAH
jgi:chemotaxis protein MotB